MMLSPHFQEAKLHTHFVDEYKKEIMANMEKVIAEDQARVERLRSTFLPSKKVAAVSAAVNSYMAHDVARKK